MVLTAKLLGHSVEVNLKNYSFADCDYCENALEALNSGATTPTMYFFRKQKAPQILVNTGFAEEIKNSG